MLNRLQLGFPLFCFVLLFSQVMANKCSQEDQENADGYPSYYTPSKAHSFGSRIQKLVMDKDLAGIFSLVPGDLRVGPTKKFIANKTFDEIFDDEWVKQVLAGDAPCLPDSIDGGFMLGNGRIFYDKDKYGRWAIYSILHAQEDPLDNQLFGWTINEQVVHPACFNSPSFATEVFGSYQKAIKIKETVHFKIGPELFDSDPGLFMGGSISNFSPIKSAWCSNDSECKQVSLVSPLDQCTPKDFDFDNLKGFDLVTDNGHFFVADHSKKRPLLEYYYTVLKPVSKITCSKLAPNIRAQCREAYLISIVKYIDSMRSWRFSYGIYGLFDLPNVGPSIVPLKFFETKNEALNFLDLTKEVTDECSKEDLEIADKFRNYYTPSEAHFFGSRIQKLVMDKDLPGIFSLVKGDLKDGPRRKFIADKTFDEIFDDEWVKQVLAEDAPCSPLVDSGSFMLGNGRVFYDKDKYGRWSIFSIFHAQEDPLDNQLLGWTINEQVVHPACFISPSFAIKIFGDFERAFNIKETQFLSDPGLFMGGAISNFSPIKSPWCSNDSECKQISLVSPLDQCTPKDFYFDNEKGFDLVTNDRGTWVQDSSKKWHMLKYYYTVLKPVSNNTCSKLAPNIGAQCREAYLISVVGYDDLKEWVSDYGIYGLFNLPNVGPSIVPLKFFETKNEALNFLDLTK